MKEVNTKDKYNKKERKFKISLKSNKYTIIDKIIEIENKELSKSIFIYLGMILCVSFALSFGSVGYSIFNEIIKNFGVYSMQVILKSFLIGLFSYLCMCFMGFIALVCYDKNVFRYGEVAVKISKYSILFIIVTMFKDSQIIGFLKELMS